jgi:hypothetical protein
MTEPAPEARPRALSCRRTLVAEVSADESGDYDHGHQCGQYERGHQSAGAGIHVARLVDPRFPRGTRLGRHRPRRTS